MRAIDADALIANIKSDFEGAAGLMASSGALFAVMSLKSAPTLDDLRPKGRWEVIEDYVSSLGYTVIDGYRCSLCKEESREALDFCGHCGADMRGGGEDA